MLRKSLFALLGIVLFGALFAAPARAQSQAVSFNVGYFTIRGHACTSTLDCNNPASAIAGSSRTSGDVLLAELNGGRYDALDFNLKDFNKVTFGGEYLLGLGEFLEAGVGVGYYKSTVPSASLNFENAGALIPQTLELRIVPITATVRFLPLGRTSVVEPYVGAGLGIYTWRYTESGQFVFPVPGDPDHPDIVCVGTSCSPSNPPYEAKGTNVGPVVLGGVRIPFGSYAIGGEIRWQAGSGSLPGPNSASPQFLSDKIDLGGISYSATFTVRFGGR